jgi:hypothetical protein
VRLAGLDALRDAAEGWEKLVAGRLADENELVVAKAARVLGVRGSTTSVPALIDALDGASPRAQYDLCRALEALAGKGEGPEAEAWARWREEHGDRPTHPWMCGVPLASSRVLFVLDVSNGTKVEPENVEVGKPWASDPPGCAPPHERIPGLGIDVAKHELKRAIIRLPASTRFNILAFKQAAIPWQRRMMAATETNKEEAYRWLRGVKAHGVSYVDGALRAAFRMAGVLDQGAGALELAADTIVFISVGAVTDNALPQAAVMDPQIVLDDVRLWNRQDLVTVHCVGIESSEYMKKLAAQNGGVYVE